MYHMLCFRVWRFSVFLVLRSLVVLFPTKLLMSQLEFPNSRYCIYMFVFTSLKSKEKRGNPVWAEWLYRLSFLPTTSRGFARSCLHLGTRPRAWTVRSRYYRASHIRAQLLSGPPAPATSCRGLLLLVPCGLHLGAA
jgi:hypothetical protein